MARRVGARVLWVSAALATLLACGSVQASSLRCEHAILGEGAHMYEVSELCGEPVAEYSRVEYLLPNVVVYVDEWVYRFGDNKFQRMLRFENGQLRDIRTLRKPRPEAFRGRGSRQPAAEYRISW